jgi:hypothetical protein
LTVLTDILPFLEGWRLKIVQVPTNTIDPAGYVRTLFRTEKENVPEPGFLMVGSTSFSNPNAILRMRLVGPAESERTFTVSPFILNAQGLTVPNGWYWCPVYNPLLPLYVVCYLPDSRHTVWSDYVSMELISVGIPTIIYDLNMIIIRVTDKEKWIKSWRKLFGGSEPSPPVS